MLIMRADVSRAVALVLGICFVAALPGGGSGWAETAPEPLTPEVVDGGYVDEVGVGWVLVPVVVRSATGYVTGLDRERFALTVDGEPTRFVDFERRHDAPVSLVFLQDLSGSMAIGGRLDAAREVARIFLERAQPGDEVAIATFAGDSVDIEVQFTEDLGAVREAITAWEGYGRTALHDAVARLPEISAPGRNVKRAVVLITDGVDNASRFAASEAREVVRRAEIPVYVLGLDAGDPYQLATDGKKVYRYSDVLNLLAHMTGGRYYAVTGPEQVKEVANAISEELRSQYVLGFGTAATGRSRYHEIAVQVDAKKATGVIARKGYEGLSPAP